LKVLNRPDAATIVALDEDRLPDVRLGREEPHDEPIRRLHAFRRFSRGKPARLRPVEKWKGAS
jgi:hypothetical protein